ncbi:MAG: OB-fold nucleic acid binding domain protein [Elusimicrobia bacterium ADurb.Bin231]|nr:MAG: OB-fold nucleic acid binding domain protein [Elusimicrobia bacterium ADurb.Bin231]
MEDKKSIPSKEIEVMPDALCPSCGRFVGPYEKCPHCQAHLTKRMSLRIVKKVAVIGSIIGLVMLWYASKLKEIPTVRIEEITERMNNALVQINGKIISVRTDDEKNSFRFTVDDGTGRMNLNGFNALSDFKKFFGKDLPNEGDVVKVVGQLNINEKFGNSMFIRSPKRVLIVEKYVPVPKKIKDITKADLKKSYIFRVTVEDVREFSAGKTITVNDGTGSIPLTIFNSQLTLITDKTVNDNLGSPGAVFELMGIVDSYRGSFQLKLKNPGHSENLKLVKKGHGISDLTIVEDTSPPVRRSPRKNKSSQKQEETEDSEITITEEE